MTPLLFFLLAVADSSGVGLWNLTAVGWLTLLLAISSVIGGFVAAGKFLGTLNGFGERLGEVEKAQEESRGHRASMQRSIDRILDQHESILQRLGESKRTAEKCSEETQDLAINIGSRIESLSRDVNAMNLQLSQRLRAVETVLKFQGD